MLKKKHNETKTVLLVLGSIIVFIALYQFLTFRTGGGMDIFFIIPILLSCIGTPILATGILMKKSTVIVCDGCHKTIKAKYIALKPDGTNLKFDYCSKACRNNAHSNHMAKAGLKWDPPADLNDSPLGNSSNKEESSPSNDLDSFPHS